MGAKRPSEKEIAAAADRVGLSLDAPAIAEFTAMIGDTLEQYYGRLDRMSDAMPPVRYPRGRHYRPGGDEDAAVFRDHANEIGDAVAVHVGELDTGIPEAHPGGRRRDGLGRLVIGGVAAAQPDPAVRVVVAQHEIGRASCRERVSSPV